MNEKFLQQLNQASDCVANGEVIAYPTETVFGLGCDPCSDIAIKKLLKIKQRTWKKGLIVIAATTKQLQPFFSKEWLQWLSTKQPQKPTTYVIPCLPSVSPLLKGNHETLAVRLTTHEVSLKLCQLSGAIVSTSANKNGQAPLLDSDTVSDVFKNQLGCIVSAAIDPSNTSSQIIDAISGNILRA